MGKENMKSYIGTKLVQAEPFVKAENKKEGYRVVYPNGYESWSPKDVFEKAYLELITNPELKTDKPSISQEMVEDFIVNYDISTKQDKITVVVATLANGFTIVESSSCVSPENYSEEVGALICKENIEKKVWSYLGFLLQTAVKDLDNTFLENKKGNKYLSFGQAIEKMKEGKKIAREIGRAHV